MYASVRELELKATATNEPRAKTEEERNGKDKGRREMSKEENNKEASAVENPLKIP